MRNFIILIFLCIQTSYAQLNVNDYLQFIVRHRMEIKHCEFPDPKDPDDPRSNYDRMVCSGGKPSFEDIRAELDKYESEMEEKKLERKKEAARIRNIKQRFRVIKDKHGSKDLCKLPYNNPAMAQMKAIKLKDLSDLECMESKNVIIKAQEEKAELEKTKRKKDCKDIKDDLTIPVHLKRVVSVLCKD